MTIGMTEKRKSIEDDGRAAKIFKEASEFFDEDSTGFDTEPTAENELVIQKEIIKHRAIKQEAVENTEISTNPNLEEAVSPQTNLQSVDEVSSDDESPLYDCDYEISDDESDETENRSTDVTKFLKMKTSSLLQNIITRLERTLLVKNKIIEHLRKENAKLKLDFESQIKVKKEILDENLVKNKKDFDRQLSNVDEEREYLIEEIKLKDSELDGKNLELKKKDEVIADWADKYKKFDKLRGELKKSLDEKEKIRGRLQEKCAKLESKLSLALKKKIVRTDFELKLQEVEKELDILREEKYKIEDENSRLEEINKKLESKLHDHDKCAKIKEEQKKLFDEELKKNLVHFEAKNNDYDKNLKSLRTELKETDIALKSKTMRIKELETLVGRKDSQLKDETASKEELKAKLEKLEESETISTEYKADLESRIKDLELIENNLRTQMGALKQKHLSAVSVSSEQLKLDYEAKLKSLEEEKNVKITKLQEESNSMIMEDLKLIEKHRLEIEQLKTELSKLESAEEEKNSLKATLAAREQEHISLQIMTSEKDELINEKTISAEKFRRKNEKLKGKLYELIQLNEGLDNRVTVTELKYFNLEKEIEEKQTLVSQLENDLSSANTNLDKMKENHSQEIEKLAEEKRILEEMLGKEKEEIANVRADFEKERADFQLKKKRILEQVKQINKRKDKVIQLNVEPIEID